MRFRFDVYVRIFIEDEIDVGIGIIDFIIIE